MTSSNLTASEVSCYSSQPVSSPEERSARSAIRAERRSAGTQADRAVLRQDAGGGFHESVAQIGGAGRELTLDIPTAPADI
jgi:hypothetical protein